MFNRAFEEDDPFALSLAKYQWRGGLAGDIRVPAAIDAYRRGEKRNLGQVSGVDVVAAGDAFSIP